MTKRITRVVIGIDPGGTTGVATWFAPTNTFATFQYPDCDKDEGLHSLIVNMGSLIKHGEPFLNQEAVHVVLERFEDRLDERFRTKIDFTAAEVIGALREWAFPLRPVVRLMRSGASMGKGFWDDDKIKKLGLWVPGQRHAMDAMRHLLRYKLFTLQHTELLAPFKPPLHPDFALG
jgi:hypothetical protein